jgi:hypothetical protein
MTHKIIKTENYLLVVDESEIKAGDWIFANQGVHIVTDVKDDKYPYGTLNNKGDKIYHHKSWKKIIAHLPLNNAPTLEGVDLLPPLEDDKALCPYPEEKQNAIDWHNGYNKAKEKYKWTDDDLIDAIEKAWLMAQEEESIYSSKEKIIQSLQQPKYPVEFECEKVTIWARNTDRNVPTLDDFDYVPKTTTNSQSQTVLVGTYIYE